MRHIGRRGNRSVSSAATIAFMQRHLLFVAAVGLLALVLGPAKTTAQTPQNNSQQKEVAPDVPDAIQVPAGEEVVLFVHASGSQVYTCQAAAGDRFSWTLKGPEAELRDRNDKVIGQHLAGPTWKLKDGSEVTGKAAAQVDSLDSDSIPW